MIWKRVLVFPVFRWCVHRIIKTSQLSNAHIANNFFLQKLTATSKVTAICCSICQVTAICCNIGHHLFLENPQELIQSRLICT